MKQQQRIYYLRLTLYIVGIIFTLGVYPLMHFWHAGFGWSPQHLEYELMFVALYFVLGIFLIIAAKNPMLHLNIIWFTSISSFVVASVMLGLAIYDRTETANFFGDIPALYLVAIILAILTPKQLTNKEYHHE